MCFHFLLLDSADGLNAGSNPARADNNLLKGKNMDFDDWFDTHIDEIANLYIEEVEPEEYRADELPSEYIDGEKLLEFAKEIYQQKG